MEKRVSTPYELSPESLEYVPTIQQIAKTENYIKRPGSYNSRDIELSENEIDSRLVEMIAEAERRLIDLQYLQKVRMERIKDKSWLRRVMGL